MRCSALVASVPALLEIRKEINKLGPGVWKERKLREVNELIVDCTGLYSEAAAYALMAQRAKETQAHGVGTALAYLNTVGGQDALVVEPGLVEPHGHGGQAGLRASSTSSTGMSSLTG